MAWPGAALADQRVTEQQSVGPSGGNAALASNHRGSSTDGTRVFFQTTESLVPADTDNSMDVYERSNGVTTLISTGPSGGNGPFNAVFLAASTDGSRVFFKTAEKMVAADTDNSYDIYERANGVTTLISTGPNGGNGSFNVVFDAITPDGSKVFFDTYEPLVSGDTDTSRDVYESSGGATAEITVGPNGGNGAFDTTFNAISDDGSKVFFSTDESLVSSDTDNRQDVYQREGGTTTHLSIGPAGGNGNLDFDYDAFFDGASANGTKVWITTDEALTFDDTDTYNDVYQVSGGAITRVSTGPNGGNGPYGAYFDGASRDGSHVFIDTSESLVPADTDTSYDVYDITGGQTLLVSTGPTGGNGPFFAAFRGATPDGSHVFFETYEPLTPDDTDANQDVYDRSNGTTTLISTGPAGGNGDIPASYDGSSADGSRVFFTTTEGLVATDADAMADVYQRSGGDTMLISTGPVDLNAPVPASYSGASTDGGRVFFETAAPLVGTDTDNAQDVYSSSVASAYARPKGASPLRVPLVPAFEPCSAPNLTHGAPLAFGSCSPPAQSSGFLTVGTPDANGKAAGATGFVSFTAVAGNPSTAANEADVLISVSITDVRRKPDLADYAGELQLLPSFRVTDRTNGSAPVDPATVADFGFPVTVPCTPTVDANVGSTCFVATSANAVIPAAIPEVKRTVIEVGQIRLLDGGPDGLASTAGDNAKFAVQGLFTP